MQKATQSEELAAACEKHHGEREGHVQRLERVFEIVGEKPQGKMCDSDAFVRVYNCPACDHERRLTVWAADAVARKPTRLEASR